MTIGPKNDPTCATPSIIPAIVACTLGGNVSVKSISTIVKASTKSTSNYWKKSEWLLEWWMMPLYHS